MTSSMAEAKTFSEEKYLEQVKRFNTILPETKKESFGLEEEEEERLERIDLKREKKSVNVLMNYIDLLEGELRRQKTKVKSLSRELYETKREVNIVREDRDYWIKQHTQDIYERYHMDKSTGEAISELKETLLSIKNQIVSN